MPKTIWKFPLRYTTHPQAIALPMGANILTVQVQRNEVCLWVLFEPSNGPVELEPRTFVMCMTGVSIEDNIGQYVGTVQLENGRTVLHVFEATK